MFRSYEGRRRMNRSRTRRRPRPRFVGAESILWTGLRKGLCPGGTE
jgi:hypothetical protein